VDDKNYKLTGDLTMHGFTKTIDLNAICTIRINSKNKQTIAGFQITGIIKRSDFDIGTSMTSALISNEVSIVVNAELYNDKSVPSTFDKHGDNSNPHLRHGGIELWSF